MAVDGLAVVFHIFPKISVLRLAPDGGGYVFLQIVMSPPSQGSQAGIVRQLLRVFTIFLLLDKPFHFENRTLFHRFFIFGSRASRRPSPKKFRANNVVAKARPGKSTNHQ